MRQIAWVTGIAAVLVLTVGSICAQEQATTNATSSVDAAKKAAVTQSKCPIMGGQINKKFFADSDGKRVYFCCPGCAPEFNKKAAEYIKKLEDSGVALEKTPAADDKKTAVPPVVDKKTAAPPAEPAPGLKSSCCN
ncbi:MAG: hypothetical protein C0404_00165 [Verrucomicrobia bacterium]|nr:hypothetical protein [Verrucomicrobiota bacterium]